MADTTEATAEAPENDSILVGGDDAEAAASMEKTEEETPQESDPEPTPAADKAPSETPDSGPQSDTDRLAALEKALEEMRAERDKAAQEAEAAKIAQARDKALADAGLTDEYGVFLDGDQETWEKKLELLSSLKGAVDKKPVSVPRDPVMGSDTIEKNNLQEQAAGFFGLL